MIWNKFKTWTGCVSYKTTKIPSPLDISIMGIQQREGKSFCVTRLQIKRTSWNEISRAQWDVGEKMRFVCRRVAGREARKSARSATLFDRGCNCWLAWRLIAAAEATWRRRPFVFATCERRAILLTFSFSGLVRASKQTARKLKILAQTTFLWYAPSHSTIATCRWNEQKYFFAL